VTVWNGSGADLPLSPEAWLQREVAAGRLPAEPSSAVVALAVEAVRTAAGRLQGADFIARGRAREKRA
jgi:hypothetical protein